MALTRQEVRERRRQPSAEVQNLVLDISERLRRLDADYLCGLLQTLHVVELRRRQVLTRPQSPPARKAVLADIRLVVSRP